MRVVRARSKLEATARLYALAGAAPEPLGPGSKEKKSVLLSLTTAFGLDIAPDVAKLELARKIVLDLDGQWDETCFSSGATLTLEGLNRLLEVATAEVERRNQIPSVQLPALLAGWHGFQPARSKLEAVNRLSALTASGPQDLGPGSKERKSVLINLADGLRLGSSLNLSKSRLGQDIATRLEAPWDDTCWSRGETITLDGLNVLLASAERRLGRLGATDPWFATLDEEAAALLGVLNTSVSNHWDGRTAVKEMRSAEFRQWRQSEWIGFYFEFIGIPALIDAFGGGSVQVLNVTFDYSLGAPWDLKAHSDSSSSAILNDARSVDQRLEEGPLGFVVLSGTSEYDEDGAFDDWHRQVTSQEGRGRSVNSDHQRRRKAGFGPHSLSSYLVRDEAHGKDLLDAGALALRSQGRQSDGKPRSPKYHLNLRRADALGMRVAHIDRRA